ncbi:hypothetical protein [Variovorax paradoxus]|uniref:hypothetical protein n=1 Tax=Variovorax paradoxus TaxID=34073 RepID=UPI0027D8EA6E|nr:hypothetical protein [Variovorax paradoxus]
MKLTDPEHFKNHEQIVFVCDDSVGLHVIIAIHDTDNQLARDEHGAQLRGREILYAPDFVINAGGLIRMASERDGFDPAGAA